MGTILTKPRSTRVDSHSMWHPKASPKPEDRAVFEQWAVRHGFKPSQWLSLCGAGAGATIGDILDLRAQLRRFASDVEQEVRTLNEAGSTQDTAKAQEGLKVLRNATYAIESCENTIDIYGGPSASQSAPFSGGGSGSQSRAFGADQAEWRSQFTTGGDIEVMHAYEAGQFGIDDFVRGIANIRSTEIVRRVLSVGTDTAGGFTVPTVLMGEILDALVPASSLLQAGAQVIRVDDMLNGGAKSFNWAAISTLPTAAWRLENGTVANSDPVFRNVQAIPRSLSFEFQVSRELLADGVGLRQALNRAIGAAFAKEMDRAGLRGTGTAPEPRGILNTVGIQAVANGANGASQATTRWANLTAAVQAILAADGPMPTAAIMAPRSLVGFSNLADTTNQPLQKPDVLREMQFIATSQIPVNLTVGTSNDCTEIYVGDFRTIRYVMREQPSIQLLAEKYASAGQVGFMCHARVDVVVTYPAAVAVVSGMRA